MPTYAYRCPACRHEYDKLQKMTDTTRAKCPKCGKRGERLISGGVGLVFKGSGFYITDYKKAGEKQPEKQTEKKPKKKDDKSSGTGAKDASPPSSSSRKEGDAS